MFFPATMPLTAAVLMAQLQALQQQAQQQLAPAVVAAVEAGAAQALAARTDLDEQQRAAVLDAIRETLAGIAAGSGRPATA